MTLRIVVAAENTSFGAAEAYAARLAWGLSKEHTVALLAPPEIHSEISKHAPGVPLHSLLNDATPRMTVAAYRILRTLKPDIVHSNSQISPSIIASAVLRVRCRVITDHLLPLHPSFGPRGRILNWISKTATRHVVVFSKQNQAVAGGTWGSSRPVSVIYPGFTPLPLGSPGEARARLGLTPSDFVVSSSGRLCAQKDFPTLIAAAELLREEMPNLRVLIAGEGEDRRALEDQIGRARLTDTVRLLGHVDDIAIPLAASDAYVQCSRWEGVCFALIEAMMAGLPTIVSDLPVFREIIGEAPASVVPTSNPKLLADAIRQMAASPMRGHTGDLLRAHALVIFDFNKMIREHLDLYRDRLTLTPSRRLVGENQR